MDFQDLAAQDVDRLSRTNDPAAKREAIARAEVHALLALASAVNRLAEATENRAS